MECCVGGVPCKSMGGYAARGLYGAQLSVHQGPGGGRCDTAFCCCCMRSVSNSVRRCSHHALLDHGKSEIRPLFFIEANVNHYRQA